MKNLSSPPLFAILFLVLIPLITEAATPLDVVINEIAWMGTEVEGIESKNWWRYEWLELYNNTNRTVSLEGWQIELYRTGLDWALNLKGEIPAQGYFLIVASDKIFSNYDFNYSNLGGKFINSGQKVLLKDSLGNAIDNLDCFSYGKWFAGDNKTKQTMERRNPLSESDSDNWAMSLNPGGTPKAKNSVFREILGEEPKPEVQLETEAKIEEEVVEVKSQPVSLPQKEPITYPSGIIINEILPSPEGPDEKEEWIEIFNQNNLEVNLSGWQITDTEGKTTTYTFPEETKISSQGFLVLFRPTSKITLNNSGDGLNLIQPNGNIIDTVTYGKAPRGQSYNRVESGWVWNSILTPGSANILPAPEKEKVEVKPPEAEKIQLKKELAAIGEQIPEETSSFFVFLIALVIAIFSGIIILILKIKLRESKNLLK